MVLPSKSPPGEAQLCQVAVLSFQSAVMRWMDVICPDLFPISYRCSVAPVTVAPGGMEARSNLSRPLRSALLSGRTSKVPSVPRLAAGEPLSI